MKKSKPTDVGLWIGKLTLRGRTVRDVIHVPGPVVIEEVDVDADIGGDVVHAETDGAEPEPTHVQPIRKVTLHVIAGGLGIASMVAASGIAAALGWA